MSATVASFSGQTRRTGQSRGGECDTIAPMVHVAERMRPESSLALIARWSGGLLWRDPEPAATFRGHLHNAESLGGPGATLGADGPLSTSGVIAELEPGASGVCDGRSGRFLAVLQGVPKGQGLRGQLYRARQGLQEGARLRLRRLS